MSAGSALPSRRPWALHGRCAERRLDVHGCQCTLPCPRVLTVAHAVAQAVSVTNWLCAGIDRIFHWSFEGLNHGLTNASGDGRSLVFFEQHQWNMAHLERFIGGNAPRFASYAVASPHPHAANGSAIAVIECTRSDAYMALIAALGPDRQHPFTTTVPLSAPVGDVRNVQQFRNDASVSAVQALIDELAGNDGLLQHSDGLPYEFERLLTARGRKRAEEPATLERLWGMHARSFRPAPFEGQWALSADGQTTDLQVTVTAPSVTVIMALRQDRRRGFSENHPPPLGPGTDF